MDLLTSLGLAIPAGLNAYIPLLSIAVAQRAGLLELRTPYDIMGSWWVIAVLAVLLAIEMLADKIPAVDSVNDVIQTVLRPAAGGIAFVVASGDVGRAHPLLAVLAGILLAGGTHAVKAAARPVVNVSTGGFGAPVVSFLEDVLAFVTSVLAIVAPLLAALGLAAIAYLLYRLLGRKRRRAALE